MTTETLKPASQAPRLRMPSAASTNRVRFPGILRSEAIKLRSLRSTVWSYAVLVLISLGLAALMAATLASSIEGQVPAEAQTAIVMQVSSFPVALGQLVAAVLGVLFIAGEYGTGMIRSTLSSVPRRLPVLWAKSLVLFATTFLVGLVSTVGAYLIGSPLLAASDVAAPLTDPDVLRAVVGGALYLALIAVFALGVGTVVRSSAGGIAVVLGIILILPTVLQLIPADWAANMIPYLLSDAGLGGLGIESGTPGGLEPWQQLLVVLGWVVASLSAGAILMKRRDA
ncbi:ABC transporter permease [Mycetocola manganoxydans]|uniref:ABC transporter permease n=1 Tax=Mycetocola manganoxydans TaxID=699879 RepID=A0A3L6ZM03_9MICO|nr:ABC transporter permease subunit [Mycetocola manganoxydans]RLP68685.1 ABC transporter permease [Mycetocola manganoxydans]GHD45350.1 ABC transporter permease [Mycetocola manganoxydans]